MIRCTPLVHPLAIIYVVDMLIGSKRKCTHSRFVALLKLHVSQHGKLFVQEFCSITDVADRLLQTYIEHSSIIGL